MFGVSILVKVLVVCLGMGMVRFDVKRGLFGFCNICYGFGFGL